MHELRLMLQQCRETQRRAKEAVEQHRRIKPRLKENLERAKRLGDKANELRDLLKKAT